MPTPAPWLLVCLLTLTGTARAQVPAAEATPAITPALPAPAAAASAPSASATPASATPAPPAQAEPEAFQGLPWGASEARIAERFGARLGRGACDAAARQTAARVGEACDSPQIDRYDVAGIPFVLRLHLHAQERHLVRVSLSHVLDGVRGDDNRWSEQHRVLRRLLSQRYGSAETTDVSNEAGITTAFARWRRGVTVIELHSLVTRSPGSSGREQVQITYQNVLHGEAGKL